MRERMEVWLQERWYGGRRPGLMLRLLARLQAGLVRLNRRRARRAWRGPVPVVVVGNLSVGGTGKTPFIAWLAASLVARGLSVGIVSRGYGRDSGETRLVDADSDWRGVGDEPLMLRRETDCPVAVGRDRPAACRLLLVHHAPDLILSDDGLQHYALARDREIVISDGRRQFGNGLLLPAGPLREPLARLSEVDWCVWNGGVPSGRDGLAMWVHSREAVNLVDGRRQPLAAFAPGPVRAVAGIGDPARFFDNLEARGLRLVRETPGDHGVWHADGDDSLPVLMTDKDAVKLTGAAPDHWWRVPVSVEVDGAGPLLDDIQSLVAARTGAATQ